MDSTSSPHTLSTSFLRPSPTSQSADSSWQDISTSSRGTNIVINIQGNNGSTGRGILIGMLSAFGSAAFVVLIFAVFYFFWYTRPGRIFLDRIGRPGEYDDEQAFAREEARALEAMDDLQRLEYLRAKAFIDVNPPETLTTDITLSQFLAIQEKGVSAWEFEPELEIANCFVEARTEIEFFDSECCVQSNLPIPKQNEVYYFEAKIYDKPDPTLVSIGVATKPYPLFRLPGYHRHSLAYTSLGPRRHNQPFTPTQYGPPYTTGDVIGVGYRPRTGTIFFTRNGRKLDDVAHGMKTQNFFPTVGANGPCNIHVNFGQSGFVFIEANVKKWGLAPMTGSLAPPPPYGSEAGSILLEQGGGNAQAQRGGGLEGWQHYQQFGQTPQQQQQRGGHVRRATPMYRPRAGTGPPMPLAHHPPPNSPGPIRSPTEISLAQLVHVDSNQGYVEDGDSDDEGEEDIGEGTSRNPVNLMDQREVMPIGAIQQRGDDEQQQHYHHQEQPSFQFPQRQQQGQPPPIPEQPVQGVEVLPEEESPPPEYTSPEGSLRRRRSDGSESSTESNPDSTEQHQHGDGDEQTQLLHHRDDDDDDDDDGDDDSEAATPPVPSYEAATAGEQYHDSSEGRRTSHDDDGSEERR